MASVAEAALSALFTALAGVADHVVRDARAPADLAPAGAGTALALVDGSEAVAGEECGPWVLHIQREAAIHVIARGRTEALTQIAWQTLIASVGAALTADRTLGGAVHDMVWGAPFETEETRVIGGPEIKAGAIPVTLYYTVSGDNPLASA